MKLVVTGAGGLLGSEFVRSSARSDLEVVGLSRTDLDVTDADAVDRRIREEAPDWVAHCAAYTAVDRAEEEPEQTMLVNRDATANVVRAATSIGARTVYVSSDYVFDGQRREPYATTAAVGPLSVYGRSKWAGEVAAQEEGRFGADAPAQGALVVRTGWLFGAGRRNFVDSILERAERGVDLKVVDDQRGRPTWARNTAETTLELMARGVVGVWHVADGGDATWLEVANEALKLRGLTARATGVSSEEWSAAAPRPTYSVLDLSATEAELGRSMMPWRASLARYLAGDNR